MREFLSNLLSALAIVLIIPTTLILISWNAIPGDKLYPLKRGLEDIALFLTIRTPIASAFSLEFTDRRFSEANILLAKKGSTLGYTLLVEGATQTKDIIVEKNDAAKAAELVAKIEEYQKTLEEKKIAVVSSPSTFLPPKPRETPQTITPLPQAPSQPPPVDVQPEPAESVEEVIHDLDAANEELEEIKDEIKEALPNLPKTPRQMQTPPTESEGRGKGKGPEKKE